MMPLAIPVSAVSQDCSQLSCGPESGRGLPHSKTLPRFLARCSFRKVLECGCPLPLWLASAQVILRRSIIAMQELHIISDVP